MEVSATTQDAEANMPLVLAKCRALLPVPAQNQIAKEVGVKSVELRTHMLPTGGHYADVMIQLATSIAGALK